MRRPAAGSPDQHDTSPGLRAASTDLGETAARSAAERGQPSTTYTYDPLGNLRSVALPDGSLVEYVVDGENHRVLKKIDGAVVQGFLWNGALRIVAELDGAGNVVSRFVYGTRANVPEYVVKGGATHRILTDHLGSPRLVVDAATGAVVGRMSYDAWGNILPGSDVGVVPFGFAGGLYDAATGLVRFGVRDYDPSVGRWTGKDPIRFEGGDPNLYAYLANDPVNGIDPTGTAGPTDTWWLPLPWCDWSKWWTIFTPWGIAGALGSAVFFGLESETASEECDETGNGCGGDDGDDETDLDRCLRAAGGGRGDWHAFCGSLPTSQMQAQCFAKQFSSSTEKSNLCYFFYQG